MQSNQLDVNQILEALKLMAEAIVKAQRANDAGNYSGVAMQIIIAREQFDKLPRANASPINVDQTAQDAIVITPLLEVMRRSSKWLFEITDHDVRLGDIMNIAEQTVRNRFRDNLTVLYLEGLDNFFRQVLTSKMIRPHCLQASRGSN